MAFFSDISNLYDVVDFKAGILDIRTPRHTLLAARYKRSHAYNAMVIEFPELLSNIVCDLIDNEDKYVREFGEEAREELSTVVKKIRRLTIRLQNDNKLKHFMCAEPDKALWNDFLDNLPVTQNSFFSACFLYAECFTYRRIISYLENTHSLKGFDYFWVQKKKLLTDYMMSIESLFKCIRLMPPSIDALRLLLKICLWGTQYPILPPDNTYMKSTNDPFKPIHDAEKQILADHSNKACHTLEAADRTKPRIIEIICEKCGYNLVTDLVLGDYIIEHKFADKIRFNLKAIPWYQTDATLKDFEWTLQYLRKQSYVAQEFCKRVTHLLEEGIFEVPPAEYFWTGPYEYYRMREVHPDLYKRLTKATLVIFKGDLNHRKLIGDLCWDISEPIITCVRGFAPANICSLRPIKTDVMCDLPQELAEQLFKKDRDWAISGQYATIHFVEKSYCGCDAIDDNTEELTNNQANFRQLTH